MIRLFVGLGNPGPEYVGTRHNAGFWWIDAAARELKSSLAFDRSYQALVARVNPHGARMASTAPIWLLEPQTYMNLSGRSVGALVRFYKIEPEQILVVHDELDLQPGQMKLKLGGGAAGHNGLKDILAQLGTPNFWRLRIGIGHPGDRAEVVNWVLRKPAPDQREAIGKCIEQSIQALPLLVDGPMERALMKIHARPPRPRPAPAPPTATRPPAAAPSASSQAASPQAASTPAGPLHAASPQAPSPRSAPVGRESS